MNNCYNTEYLQLLLRNERFSEVFVILFLFPANGEKTLHTGQRSEVVTGSAPLKQEVSARTPP